MTKQQKSFIKKSKSPFDLSCNCGEFIAIGDDVTFISGSIDGKSADWVECPNCTGRALGKAILWSEL